MRQYTMVSVLLYGQDDIRGLDVLGNLSVKDFQVIIESEVD